MLHVKHWAPSRGAIHVILLKILAYSRLRLQPSLSLGPLLLSPKGKGTLRGTHPTPPLLSVPVGSRREFVPLPYKARPGWPGVTCHAIRAQRMSAMLGE